MNISEVDLKILWGKAAGRCSYPGCSNNCISYFEKSGDKILGEMAHVIPQSSDGPRGTAGIKGPDTYENLILLCPYHHEMIDKAPADFPNELLQRNCAAISPELSGDANHLCQVILEFRVGRASDFFEKQRNILKVPCAIWLENFLWRMGIFSKSQQ